MPPQTHVDSDAAGQCAISSRGNSEALVRTPGLVPVGHYKLHSGAEQRQAGERNIATITAGFKENRTSGG
jgi:hypothetical protein